MTFLFLLFNIVFIIIFVVMGLWWLAAVPLVALLFLLGGNNDLVSKDKTDMGEKTGLLRLDTVQDFFTQHALVLSRCLVVFGGWGLMDIYTNLGSEVLLRLLGVHMILWFASYVFDYEDGKHVFQIGYFLALILISRYIFGQVDWFLATHVLMGLLVMTMGLYSCLVFVFGAIGKESSEIVQYILFLLFNLSLIILIYSRARNDLSSAAVLSQIYLMALYCLIYGVYRYYEQIRDDVVVDTDDLVQEVLDGKRLLGRSIPFVSSAVVQARSFLVSLDVRTTFMISFLNVVLVFFQVRLFVQGFDTTTIRLTQGIFRFGLTAFFVNYLLLREIGFYHDLQRVVAFVLLNFGIYLSILQGFGGDYLWMVFMGVLWSLINSLVLLFADKLKLDTLLERKDMLYWLATTAVATLCNIYFILRLDMSNQFKFSFIFLYIGIQGILFLYAWKKLLASSQSIMNQDSETPNIF